MPEVGQITVTPGIVDRTDGPLAVKYVEDKDWSALLFNVTSILMVIITLVTILIVKKTHPFAVIALPVCLAWVIGYGIKDRLWVTVDAQEVVTYVDKFFSREIIAYTQGGHFTRWSSDRQNVTIDFLKFEEIVATRENQHPVKATSADGYNILADLQIFFRYCKGYEALTRSLKYRPEELRALILATVSTAISNVCGRYKYDVLVANKARFGALIAGIFAGERRRCQFEIDTGTEVNDPALLDFGLTPESRAIYDTRAKSNAVDDTITKLLSHNTGNPETDITIQEAARIAQTMVGAATRQIHTYEGVPEGATTVALGDTGGIAVGGGSGRGR